MRVNRLALAADLAVLFGLVLFWTGTGKPTPPFALWIPLAVAAVICVMGSLWQVDQNVRLGIMGLTTALLLVAWSKMDSLATAVLGMVVWALFVVRRVRFVRGYLDDDVQVGRLLWDLGYMVVTAIAASTASAAVSPLHRWIGASFILMVMLRIGGMRTAQIERAKRRGVADVPSLFGPFAAVTVVLGAALLVFFAFPGVRLLVVIATIGLCLIAWLFSSRQNIISAAILTGIMCVFLWFVNYLEKHGRKKPFHPTNVAGTSAFGGRSLHPHPVHHASIPSYVWFIVAFVAIALFFIVLQQMSRRRPNAQVVDGAPIIVRTRMTSQPGGTYREGPGIIGLTMRWLNAEHQRGRALGSGETVRAFLDRLSRPSGGNEEAPVERSAAQTLDHLVTLYEAERYGQQSVPDDEVGRLKERLQSTGRMGTTKRK